MRVRFARIGFFIPSAIRIADAAEAIIVTAVAHDNVDLPDAVIRRSVNGFVLFFKIKNNKLEEKIREIKEILLLLYLWRDFHHADWLRSCDFKNIQQLGFALLGCFIEPLDHFVNLSFDYIKKKQRENIFFRKLQLCPAAASLHKLINRIFHSH